MKALTTVLAFSIMAAASPQSVCAADQPPELTHNPFSRPPSNVSRDDRVVISNDHGTQPSLALQATMVGETSRLADVAGRILKPGDEVEGYLLVAIHEEYAVFDKGGKSITVYVKPQQAEDDE